MILVSGDTRLVCINQAEWPSAGAIWDIWAAADEPKLTAFLWRLAREESGGERAEQLVGHPIHDANIYLTAALRRRLWAETGVQSYPVVLAIAELSWSGTKLGNPISRPLGNGPTHLHAPHHHPEVPEPVS